LRGKHKNVSKNFFLENPPRYSICNEGDIYKGPLFSLLFANNNSLLSLLPPSFDLYTANSAFYRSSSSAGMDCCTGLYRMLGCEKEVLYKDNGKKLLSDKNFANINGNT
jgi:hypothetical protein